ncbi:MAG: hypothetical protein AAF108_02960 [Planctomycetota bacterium]
MISYRDLTQGPDTQTPTDVAPVPILEPGAISEPPYPPAFVRGVRAAYRPRITKTAAGRTRSTSLQTRPRGSFEIVWDGLNKAERDELWAWLTETVEGRLRAFTFRVDGQDETPITGILVDEPAEVQVHLNGYRISANVQETFA